MFAKTIRRATFAAAGVAAAGGLLLAAPAAFAATDTPAPSSPSASDTQWPPSDEKCLYVKKNPDGSVSAYEDTCIVIGPTHPTKPAQ